MTYREMTRARQIAQSGNMTHAQVELMKMVEVDEAKRQRRKEREIARRNARRPQNVLTMQAYWNSLGALAAG